MDIRSQSHSLLGNPKLQPRHHAFSVGGQSCGAIRINNLATTVQHFFVRKGVCLCARARACVCENVAPNVIEHTSTNMPALGQWAFGAHAHTPVHLSSPLHSGIPQSFFYSGLLLSAILFVLRNSVVNT